MPFVGVHKGGPMRSRHLVGLGGRVEGNLSPLGSVVEHLTRREEQRGCHLPGRKDPKTPKKKKGYRGSEVLIGLGNIRDVVRIRTFLSSSLIIYH